MAAMKVKRGINRRLACAWLAAAATMAASAPARACLSRPIIYFQAGSATIGPDGEMALSDFVSEVLTRGEAVRTVRVIGHSDRTGRPATRERIATARARMVADALMARGLPMAKVEAAGVADRLPAVETADNVREPLNRRVELVVSEIAAPSDGTVCH